MTVTPEQKAAVRRVGKGRPRQYRVATPAGAERYGQPIGTIIRLDAEGNVIREAGTRRAQPAPASTAKRPKVAKEAPDEARATAVRDAAKRLPATGGPEVEDAADKAEAYASALEGDSNSDEAQEAGAALAEALDNLPDEGRIVEAREALREQIKPEHAAPGDGTDPDQMTLDAGAGKPGTPATGRKPTPAQARLEAARAELRTRADEMAASDNPRAEGLAATLRELADDPTLVVGPPGTVLVGAKSSRGSGYTVYDSGTGSSLGAVGTGLKKAEVVPFINRVTAATANGDDDSGPLLGSLESTEKVKTWTLNGESAQNVLVGVRAALDTDNGYTGTSAQESERYNVERRARALPSLTTDELGEVDASLAVGESMADDETDTPMGRLATGYDLDNLRRAAERLRKPNPDPSHLANFGRALNRLGDVAFINGKDSLGRTLHSRAQQWLDKAQGPAGNERRAAMTAEGYAPGAPQVGDEVAFTYEVPVGRPGGQFGAGAVYSPYPREVQGTTITLRGTVADVHSGGKITLSDATYDGPNGERLPIPERANGARRSQHGDDTTLYYRRAAGSAPDTAPDEPAADTTPPPVDRADMVPADAVRDIVSTLDGPKAERFSNLGDDVGAFQADSANRPETDADAARVEAAWADLDDALEALAETITDDDTRLDLIAITDDLRARGRRNGYDLYDFERRERRAGLARRGESDLDAMRAEYEALPIRDFEAREDYEAEFESRGLDRDGSRLPEPDEAGADSLREAVALLGDDESEDDREAVERAAEAYADTIAEDSGDDNAAVLAVDLEDALDALAAEPVDYPGRDRIITEIRESIRPEHRRRDTEVPGQLGLDEAADEPVVGDPLPPRNVPDPDPTAPLTDEQYEARMRLVEERVQAALAAGEDTETKYSTDGVWTPERAAQHREIIEELWAAAANVPRDRKAIIAGGLGGSGKGTVLKGPAGIDKSQYLTIDPDAIKEMMTDRGMTPTLRGLTPMESAALIHEESSYLSELLRERAQAEGVNLILDMTMGKRKSALKKLDGLEASGYDKPRAVFVTVPLETSVQRALSRHRNGVDRARAGISNRGGRYVPPFVIRLQRDDEYGSVNRRVFLDLYREGRFGEAQEFDNTGTAPVPVELPPMPEPEPEPVAEVVPDPPRRRRRAALAVQPVGAQPTETDRLLPEPIDRDTPVARPVLYTYQRRNIVALGLDNDSDPDVAQAARRIRHRQPLTAPQAAALARALSESADADGVGVRARRSRLRAAQAVDAASIRLGEPPTLDPADLYDRMEMGANPKAVFVRDLTEGDEVALPGRPDLIGRLEFIDPVMGGRLTRVAVVDADGNLRFALLDSTTEGWLLPPLPEPELPDLDDADRLTDDDRERLAEAAVPVADALRNAGNTIYGRLSSLRYLDSRDEANNTIDRLLSENAEQPEYMTSTARGESSFAQEIMTALGVTDARSRDALRPIIESSIRARRTEALQRIRQHVNDSEALDGETGRDHLNRLVDELVTQTGGPYSGTATPGPAAPEVDPTTLALTLVRAKEAFDANPANAARWTYKPPTKAQAAATRRALTDNYLIARRNMVRTLRERMQEAYPLGASNQQARDFLREQRSDLSYGNLGSGFLGGEDRIAALAVGEGNPRRLASQNLLGTFQMMLGDALSKIENELEDAALPGKRTKPDTILKRWAETARPMTYKRSVWESNEKERITEVLADVQSRVDKHLSLGGDTLSGEDGLYEAAVPDPVEIDPDASFEDNINRLVAALGPQSEIGKASVTRTRYADTDVERLARGEVPKVISETKMEKDRAPDGGPGLRTMRQFEIMTQIGRLVNQESKANNVASTEAVRVLTNGRTEAEYLADTERAKDAAYDSWLMADRVLNAKVDEIRERVGTTNGQTWADISERFRRLTGPDAVEAYEGERENVVAIRGLFVNAVEDDAEFRNLSRNKDRRWDDYKMYVQFHNASVGALERAKRVDLDAALARVREMGTRGNGAAIRMTPIAEGSSLNVGGTEADKALDPTAGLQAIRDAEGVYPTDWLRAAAFGANPIKVGMTRRGFHTGTADNAIIMISGNNAESRRDTAVHELGHHFEKSIPGLLAMESAFYWKRTSTGPVGARVREDEVALYGGKDIGMGVERTRRDDWTEPYTGKEYLGGSAYEIFTTGVESVLGNGNYVGSDLEMREFVIGALAALGRLPGTGPATA